ncbi:protein-export chaperone SecB [Candidatus Orientia mediorientalis]|uniref:protein-export chaperone SecB n=1 Tax=Candidatus Orientia mediorientalis TaxID=911112 RepID=UPI00351D2829
MKPKIAVKAQYVKDLSFENPDPINSLFKITEKPKIDTKLDINITKLSEDNHFEVELSANVSATHKDKKIFHIEIIYAGIFHLTNVADEDKKFILSVRCPEIIFPYVRQIISESTQRGGFLPLMIDHIDFAEIVSQSNSI